MAAAAPSRDARKKAHADAKAAEAAGVAATHAHNTAAAAQSASQARGDARFGTALAGYASAVAGVALPGVVSTGMRGALVYAANLTHPVRRGALVMYDGCHGLEPRDAVFLSAQLRLWAAEGGIRRHARLLRLAKPPPYPNPFPPSAASAAVAAAVAAAGAGAGTGASGSSASVAVAAATSAAASSVPVPVDVFHAIDIGFTAADAYMAARRNERLARNATEREATLKALPPKRRAALQAQKEALCAEADAADRAFAHVPLALADDEAGDALPDWQQWPLARDETVVVGGTGAAAAVRVHDRDASGTSFVEWGDVLRALRTGAHPLPRVVTGSSSGTGAAAQSAQPARPGGIRLREFVLQYGNWHEYDALGVLYAHLPTLRTVGMATTRGHPRAAKRNRTGGFNTAGGGATNAKPATDSKKHKEGTKDRADATGDDDALLSSDDDADAEDLDLATYHRSMTFAPERRERVVDALCDFLYTKHGQPNPHLHASAAGTDRALLTPTGAWPKDYAAYQARVAASVARLIRDGAGSSHNNPTIAPLTSFIWRSLGPRRLWDRLAGTVGRVCTHLVQLELSVSRFNADALCTHLFALGTSLANTLQTVYLDVREWRHMPHLCRVLWAIAGEPTAPPLPTRRAALDAAAAVVAGAGATAPARARVGPLHDLKELSLIGQGGQLHFRITDGAGNPEQEIDAHVRALYFNPPADNTDEGKGEKKAAAAPGPANNNANAPVVSDYDDVMSFAPVDPLATTAGAADAKDGVAAVAAPRPRPRRRPRGVGPLCQSFRDALCALLNANQGLSRVRLQKLDHVPCPQVWHALARHPSLRSFDATVCAVMPELATPTRPMAAAAAAGAAAGAGADPSPSLMTTTPGASAGRAAAAATPVSAVPAAAEDESESSGLECAATRAFRALCTSRVTRLETLSAGNWFPGTTNALRLAAHPCASLTHLDLDDVAFAFPERDVLGLLHALAPPLDAAAAVARELKLDPYWVRPLAGTADADAPAVDAAPDNKRSDSTAHVPPAYRGRAVVVPGWQPPRLARVMLAVWMTDSLMHAVAYVLRHNTTLHTLELSVPDAHRYGGRGAPRPVYPAAVRARLRLPTPHALEAVADALAYHNTTLQSLEVNDGTSTSFGPGRVPQVPAPYALGPWNRMLRRNTVLRSLSLTHVHGLDRFTQAPGLLRSLSAHNRVLTSLHLPLPGGAAAGTPAHKQRVQEQTKRWTPLLERNSAANLRRDWNWMRAACCIAFARANQTQGDGGGSGGGGGALVRSVLPLIGALIMPLAVNDAFGVYTFPPDPNHSDDDE